MSVLKYCFNLACLGIALGMTAFWLYKFWKDEDIVQMDFQPFELIPSEELPILSLCFSEVFIESRLKYYNESLTNQMYLEFLRGDQFYSGIDNIDFDNVTKDLADFYITDVIVFRNGTFQVGTYPNFVNGLPQVTFAGFIGPYFVKCFGIRSSYSNIKYGTFALNSSIFPNGIRPTTGFMANFHLPNILSMSWIFAKSTWPIRKDKRPYVMIFSLQQVDVLKRRRKRTQSCASNAFNYDELALEEHLNEVGCRAPYQKTDKDWKICSSKENMKKAKIDLMGETKKEKACTSAASIVFAYDEETYAGNIDAYVSEHFQGVEDDDDFDQNWFLIQIQYPDEYKQIKMVKAVDIHSAIGNSGGYIGLFLGNVFLLFGRFDNVLKYQLDFETNKNIFHIGYAFLQLPDFFVYLHGLIRETFTGININTSSKKLNLPETVRIKEVP